MSKTRPTQPQTQPQPQPQRPVPKSEEDLLDPDYLHVAPSNIAGDGLFTSRAFEEGEVIAIIAGDVIDAEECARREAAGNVYIYDHSPVYIDTDGHRRIRHLNHRCDPNAVVEGRDEHTLWLVAGRPIAAGEELTIDYDFDEIHAMCRCRSVSCRGPSEAT